MKDFVYSIPTEIVFGKDTHQKTAELIKKHGGSKVFVVYGGGSVVRSGLLDEITAQLQQNAVDYKTYGGVKPNPISSHVRSGIKEALNFGADFILAIGGGSVIDEAKAVAHGAKNPETDFWKYWEKEAVLSDSLPVGVVLTISAAGSETSDSAVITNDETGKKRGLSTDFNRPRFAIMNPELTFTLPKFQIACGIVDIMMHTMDRYFTQSDNQSVDQSMENQTTDEISASLLRVVIKNGSVAVENPTDYDAMSELMWCGSLSHNGLTGLGRPRDFSVHQLGHELSGKFDVAHGASLSSVWGSWAKYCYKTNPKRFVQYAKSVWGIESEDIEKAVLAGINSTVNYFESLGMPINFSQLGIGKLSENEIDELADSCVFHGKRLVGNFKPLNKDDIISIYKMANS